MYTENEIKALKKKHGDIFLVEVEPEEVGGEPISFLFRKPDRATLSAAAKFAQADPLKAGEILVKNCLVKGDASLLDDMAIFSAVSEQFDTIAQGRKASLKKL